MKAVFIVFSPSGHTLIAARKFMSLLEDNYRDIAPCLMRRFVCFRGLADAGGLADWKRAACALEARSRTPRAINVDPGYVDGARLVLASTKEPSRTLATIWLDPMPKI